MTGSAGTRSTRRAPACALGAALAVAAAGAVAEPVRDAGAFRFDALPGLQVGNAVRLRAEAPETMLLAVHAPEDDVEETRHWVAADDGADDEPYRFGLDYLHGKSTMSFDYRTRSGSDHEPGGLSLGVARSAFGGQTTFRVGVARGDEATSGGADTLEESIEQFNYTLGFSQVLSRSLLMDVGYATGVEEGHAAALDPADPAAAPGDRASSALSLKAFKNWSDSASTLFGYRYFWDSWDVRAHAWEAEHTNQLRNGWLVDLYYRYYTQGKASFLGEGFAEELSLSARDRELGTFASSTLGARLRYELFDRAGGFNNGSLNLSYEVVEYDYGNFAGGEGLGEDPYSISADSLRLFFSLRY